MKLLKKRTPEQLLLFNNEMETAGNQMDLPLSVPFPSTRYQGSKNKLTNWIWESIQNLNFDTVLDAFGGTGSVAHLLKRMGKKVVYNDILLFNTIIGKALIENRSAIFPEENIPDLFQPNPKAGTFVQEAFAGIYFTDDENREIDTLIANIQELKNCYEQAIAYFALFQTCIAKRPYNLFHRANLYVRLSEVKRSFGNKTTWDRPVAEHFSKYVREANRAVFDSGRECLAMNHDVFEIPVEEHFDLVYIDTPYISEKGIGTNYLEFYHFLEGMVHYREWPELVAWQYKHKPIRKNLNLWTDKIAILDNFERLFRKFRDSICVISYRSNGFPTIDELCNILSKFKSKIQVQESETYQYVLSPQKNKEVLIIGQ